MNGYYMVRVRESAYLLGVSNPSPLKTCPRCPPQAVQTISVRSLPNDRSSCRETAPGRANCILESARDSPENMFTVKKCRPATAALQQGSEVIPVFFIIYVDIHRTWWYSYKGVCRTLCKSRGQFQSAYCTRPFPGVQCLSGGGSGTVINEMIKNLGSVFKTKRLLLLVLEREWPSIRIQVYYCSFRVQALATSRPYC